ncbi:MAG: PilN domain-containing protein [Gammaproteobacteria bacterium]|nr:PilN domain-containing protein [Gammaproteobacteria bacterium]
MSILTQPIKLDAAGFFRWWGDELAALVPTWLKKLFGGSRPVLVLKRATRGVEVTLWAAGRTENLGEFSLDEEGRARREDLMRQRIDVQHAEVLLDLTPSDSMVRRFRLPAATEENLAQVAGFELDRLTPFTTEQVYYHVRLIERLPDTKQIYVELALTPRNRLDPLLEELAASGWFADRVEIAADPAKRAHQLLPERFQKPGKRLPRILNSALAALLVGLALLIVVLPIWRDYRRSAELEQEMRKVSKVAKEVETLRQDAEKLSREASFLTKRKRSEPAMVDVINELSRVIPNNTWLYGLQYKDRRLVIQGQSPSASSLIAVMEASPYLHNTSFVSPVTKDVSSGFERFQIASQVLNGRFPDAKSEASGSRTQEPE